MARRVLCCSGSLDGGGSERQLWQLACGLERQLLLPSIHLLYRRGVYLDQLPPDVAVYAFDQLPPTAVNWPGRIHQRQVQHLRTVLREADIDVVYDRTYHSTLITAPACRRGRVPRVSVIVSPPSRDLGASRERFKWFKRRLLAAAYADPNARTLAVSEAVAEDAQQYYRLPPRSIRVIPSPVDVSAILGLAAQSEIPNLQDRKSADGTTLRIAIVARLTEEKGHDLLLQALAKLSELRPGVQVQLNVIGDGPLRQPLEQQAVDLGVNAMTHFFGFQSNPYPWMRQADVVCIPSRYEGLPNVALEAMVLGVPLILSNCNRSMIDLAGSQRERAAITAVDDPVELCSQLVSVVEQRALWERRTAAARLWVEQRHGLTQWLSEMGEMLLAMAAPKREGSRR